MSNLVLRQFGSNVLLQHHQPVKALLLHLLGHIVAVMFGSVCAFLLAVSKCSHAVEACCAYKVHQLVKVFLRFAGETNHERCADTDARHFAAHGVDEFERLSFGNMALHAAEHIVRDVLQGNVQIIAHIVVLAHNAQQVCGEVGGVGIVQSYPLHAGDFCHAFNELGYFALLI